jgi:ElaB/YqjD/DUF883 family membrane-anchored ribosome-binding protein
VAFAVLSNEARNSHSKIIIVDGNHRKTPPIMRQEYYSSEQSPWPSRRSRSGDRQHSAVSYQENTPQVGYTLFDQIRENPIPALLIGAGVAWLILDRARADDWRTWSEMTGDMYGEEAYPEMEQDEQVAGATESTGQKVAGKLAEAKDKASQVAGQAREKLRQTGEHLRERARQGGQEFRARTSHARHEMQNRVRGGYERAQERLKDGCVRTQAQLQQAADEHPLATGAACLGIGLLAGFLLPKTEREDEWFGDVSDAVKGRVTETGHDLVERGKHVAEAATEAMRSEAERQGLTPEHLKESAKAVGDKALQSAKDTAKQEGIAPQGGS